MEHLSNDHEDHPNQPKLCDKTGHPVVNLMVSLWKPKQQHDQNFPMEGSHCTREQVSENHSL